MSELADRLKVARSSAGLTQADMADRAGVTRQTIVAYEKGEGVSVAYVIALCEAAGVSADWLLMGKGTMAYDAPNFEFPPELQEQMESIVHLFKPYVQGVPKPAGPSRPADEPGRP